MPDNSRETELLTLLQAREEEIGRLQQEVTLLRQKIDLLVRQIFGPSSSRRRARRL